MMHSNLNIHPWADQPDVVASEYKGSLKHQGCYVDIIWEEVVITLHVSSPEDLILLGQKLEAEGRSLLTERLANPSHAPTVAEAMQDPDAFVDGMVEEVAEHTALPF